MVALLNTLIGFGLFFLSYFWSLRKPDTFTLGIVFVVVMGFVIFQWRISVTMAVINQDEMDASREKDQMIANLAGQHAKSNQVLKDILETVNNAALNP